MVSAAGRRVIRAEEWWNAWAIRLAAGSSLGLHILVLLLANVRRYNKAHPFWNLSLWVAYQLLDIVGKFALDHLSLDDTGDDASQKSEQLLVAFWAPFLLLHLGGPDNIGAYSLDDDNLSWRKLLAGACTAVGAMNLVLYKVWLTDNGCYLIPASAIMFILGFWRFFENVLAMWRSPPKKPPIKQRGRNGWWQRLLHEAIEEAGKIYDMLYTKAVLVHSGQGYALRLAAPLLTAIALILFSLYPKDCVQAADVAVTYVLLSLALVLDVGWLVAALGSPSFDEQRTFLRCGGLWRDLYCIALLLNPLRLLGIHPGSCGCGSCSDRHLHTGRLNLVLQAARAPPGCMERLCSWLGGIFRRDADVLSDYSAYKLTSKLPDYVKPVLFQGIAERLYPPPTAADAAELKETSAWKDDIRTHCKGQEVVVVHETRTPRKNADPYAMKDVRAHWGQVAVRRRKRTFPGIVKLQEQNFFGSEFQEDILLWHIATTIYLYTNDHKQRIIEGTDDHAGTVQAIEVVSEYLMFLLAARPHMLPGTPLPNLYKVTRKALQDLYTYDKKKKKANGDLCCESRKEKLAEAALLLGDRCVKEQLRSCDSTRLIWFAAQLASQLHSLAESHLQDVVEFVFDVWVDKLMYASIKCSWESHARQLGRGGELITISWIMAEQAGLFKIGETGEGTDGNDNPPSIKPPKKVGEDYFTPVEDEQLKVEGRKIPVEDEQTPCCGHNPSEPGCPHTCCIKDYCCTQDYYYC